MNVALFFFSFFFLFTIQPFLLLLSSFFLQRRFPARPSTNFRWRDPEHPARPALGFRWGMLLVATDMFHRSASSMTWWPRANDKFLEISSLMKSSCAPMEARWHYCTVSRRIMAIGSKLSVTGNISRFFKRENPKKLYIRGCSNWKTTYFHKLFSSKLPLYSHKRLLSS